MIDLAKTVNRTCAVAPLHVWVTAELAKAAGAKADDLLALAANGYPGAFRGAAHELVRHTSQRVRPWLWRHVPGEVFTAWEASLAPKGGPMETRLTRLEAVVVELGEQVVRDAKARAKLTARVIRMDAFERRLRALEETEKCL